MVKMSYMPNNVNVIDFDIYDLLWNLEEYHRKSINTNTILLCGSMIGAFHDSNSVLRVWYGDSKSEFRLWMDGDDPKYPHYVINIGESVEVAPLKGSVLTMIVYLFDHKTKIPVMYFKGPVYQMRKGLTFNENKALGEWVCGFDKEKKGSNEDQG